MPHDHSEHEALIIEDDAGNLEAQIVVDALQKVLISKGLLTAREVTGAIAKLESPGIHLGAQVVAKAWTDPSYRALLLEDGRAAVDVPGRSRRQPRQSSSEDIRRPPSRSRKTAQSRHHSRRKKARHNRECNVQSAGKMDPANFLKDTVASSSTAPRHRLRRRRCPAGRTPPPPYGHANPARQTAR